MGLSHKFLQLYRTTPPPLSNFTLNKYLQNGHSININEDTKCLYKDVLKESNTVN